MIRFLSEISLGFFYPFRGLKVLVRTPTLWAYMLIPLLINLGVFSFGVYAGFSVFTEFVHGFLPQSEAWYWAALAYLLWGIAVVLSVTVVFFTFTLIGNLIASPFNELLSEKVEKRFFPGTREEEPFSLKGFFREMPRIILDEGRRLLFYLLGLLVLALCLVIPVIGAFIYAVSSAVFTIFFLSLDYLSYPMARRKMLFPEQRRCLLRHKALSSGFGAGALCLILIPFLQFLTIPASVTGATLLWKEKMLPSSES